MAVKDFYKIRQDFEKSKLGLDKGLGFAKINIVNPTALLRFGERRQFLFL